jgi:hypothetical protein
MKALTNAGHIEQHGAARWPSATGQDVTGPRSTSLELARPEGQTSNSALDTLSRWNTYLECHTRMLGKRAPRSIQRANPLAKLQKGRLVQDWVCVNVGFNRLQIDKARVRLVILDALHGYAQPMKRLVGLSER